MTQDQRIQELIAEFQQRTHDAYKEGGMPTTVFCLKYATDDTTMTIVWQVPPMPAGGGGSGREAKQ